ncbi:MAG: flagellar protein FlaG [Candidatus Lambdaproteobacteria bacterium]|nr:flagellar protein FlaG [Candidatus Lambdaproteobacteria bacterium]
MKIINRHMGLAAHMIGSGAKVPDLKMRPLVDPNLMVDSNRMVMDNLEAFKQVTPDKVRAESLETLERAVDSINVYLRESQTYQNVRFSLDEASGRTIAVISDMNTGERLKQIPSESLVTLAARLRSASGLLVDVLG